MKFPNSFIDELISRVDIVDVIDKRVPLKRAGREYSACCPFHAEKTPSFTVSPQKQFYHCFGCGAHGTAIGFLMQYERMSFPEAVEELAGQAGIPLPEDASGAQKTFDKDEYELLQQVAQFYHNQLLNGGERLQQFLTKRGISRDSVSQFQLGFAPPGWSTLADRFRDSRQRRTLLKLGLLGESKKNQGVYDRFRDRLMFPICDQRGRVIGFGGRSIGDDNPKYLNSPESHLFHKGRELFNLHQARRHVDPAPLVVVEGYMDVLMLAQYEVPNAVASLGTAVTPVQIQRMFKCVDRLVFCFDGDRAGDKAAWRTVEQALPYMTKGREIQIMKLPAGEDPDSIVRSQGQQGFQALLEQSIPLSDFFFEQLLSRVDNLNEGGRARLVELAQPLLSNLPDGVYRHLMFDRLSKYAMVDATAIQPPVQAEVSNSGATPAKAGSNRLKPSNSPLRTALVLLLQKPTLAGELEQPREMAALRLEGIDFFVKIVEILQQQPHLSCAALMEKWRDQTEGRWIAALASMPVMVPESGMAAEFHDAVARLRHMLCKQRIDDLLAKAQQQPLSEHEQGQLKALFLQKQAKPAELT